MTAFWLILMFIGVTMLTYGLLLRRDSKTPAE